MLLTQDRKITGTLGAADDKVRVFADALATVTFQFATGLVGTVTFEGTDDDATNPVFVAIPATNVATGTRATTIANPASAIYRVDASGLRTVQARVSAYTSGSAAVIANGSLAPYSDPSGVAGGGGGGGGAVTVVDGGDIAQGTTTDAGIITDSSGTVIGFLRGAIIQWITQLSRMGSVTETAPATDTASSGLNGRLQRIAQRLTSLIALLPSALVGGRLDVNVGATVTPANVALDATVGTTNTEIGGLTETAPATDTASSGLNGRLQRIAQRLTSLIALVPAALTGSGNFKVSLAESTANQAVAGTTATGASSVGLNPVTVGMNGAGALVRNFTEANAAAATTGTGVVGVGPLSFDGTNYQKTAGDTSGRQIVIGGAATGAAVAGNPLLMGAGTTAAGGNAQSLWVESAAAPYLRIALFGSTNGGLSVGNFADGATAANNTAYCLAQKWSYNGSTFDRDRNNVDVTLLASAARTTTQTSADIITYNAGAITLTLDMTVVGTGSVTVTINGKDPASGKYFLLLSGAAVVTNVTNVYVVDPAIPAVANVSAQKRLPRIIQVVVTANNANSATYSVGYTLQPC